MNIGAEKSPSPNIVLMCERWERMASVFALSFGSAMAAQIFTGAAVGDQAEAWCVVLS